MNNRFIYLDILRLLSLMLVMFGHYVLVAGGALDIPLVMNPNLTLLPIIDNSRWDLWKLEVFLVEYFSTQTAILCVSLFFIITGYLMPAMLERYNRLEFLINRLFRIFPTLIVATLLVSIVVAICQDIHFPVSSYLASWTLSYLLVGTLPIMGVLWTLIVEVIFYLLACLVGRFSFYKLLLLQTFLLIIILLSAKGIGGYYMMLFAMQSKYLLMITIGSALFLAEKELDIKNKISLILSAIILSYVGFQLFKAAHADDSTYNNIGTHLLAVGIFLAVKILQKYLSFNKSPKIVFFFSELVYPIYLIHVAVGLCTMVIIRNITLNPYIMLLSAVLVSLMCSYLLHIVVERPSIRIGRFFINKLRSINSI